MTDTNAAGADRLDEILETFLTAAKTNYHDHEFQTDEYIQSKSKADLRRLMVAERIDENWKTREYVTTHHYDLTAGRKTDEYLEQRIAELQQQERTE